MPHDSTVPVKVEADELYSPNSDVSPPASVPDKRLSRSNSRRQASSNGTSSKDQSPTPEDSNHQSKSRVSAKRTEQNRRAQKAFRERKMLYVKNLEAQLEAAMAQMGESERLRRENTEMRAMLEALRAENQRLLRVAQRNGGSRPLSPEDDSPSGSSSVSNGEDEEEDDDNEVPQSPPVDIGKLRAELGADSGLLSTVLTHIDADGRFAISNDMFFEQQPATYVTSDPVLFQAPAVDEGALFPPSAAPIVLPEVPLTPAAFAASNAAGVAATGDYFSFTPMVAPAAGVTAAVPVATLAGGDPSLLTTPLAPETMISLDPSLFPTTAAPTAAAAAAPVAPSTAATATADADASAVECALAAAEASPSPSGSTSSSSSTSIAAGEPPVGHKRTLDEATLYAPAGAPPAGLPRFFAKNESAQRDPHQAELCELMAKTTCKEKNPELRQQAKFFKKAST